MFLSPELWLGLLLERVYFGKDAEQSCVFSKNTRVHPEISVNPLEPLFFFNAFQTARKSFMPQCNHGIKFRGPPRRQITRRGCDANEQRRNSEIDNRIGRAHSE